APAPRPTRLSEHQACAYRPDDACRKRSQGVTGTPAGVTMCVAGPTMDRVRMTAHWWAHLAGVVAICAALLSVPMGDGVGLLPVAMPTCRRPQQRSKPWCMSRPGSRKQGASSAVYLGPLHVWSVFTRTANGNPRPAHES